MVSAQSVHLHTHVFISICINPVIDIPIKHPWLYWLSVKQLPGTQQMNVLLEVV
jgi:hypothetical protein